MEILRSSLYSLFAAFIAFISLSRFYHLSKSSNAESTVVPTIAEETKTILKTATSASSKEALQEESTDSVPNLNEQSKEDNNSISEVDSSQNYTQINNSSFFTNTPYLDKLNPAGENRSFDNISLINSGTDKKTTTEENANVYNITMGEILYNISTIGDGSLRVIDNKSNVLNDSDDDDDRIVNMSTSTVPQSREPGLQPNTPATTEGLGMDTQTASEQMTNNGTECGVKNSAKGHRRKRVVSGKLNSPGEWPWLVSMHFLIEFEFTRKSGFKHTCGASLVAPGWIITAAHCFSDDLIEGLSNLTFWRVYFGMHDLAKADSDHFVQERLIEAIYPYPHYDILNEPLLYDLALVKLNESVDVNDRVSPVCLDDYTDLHDGEKPCFVSGWGQISLSSPGSRFPYTTSLSTMSLSKCKDMYDKLPDDNEVKQSARIIAPVLCAAVGDNGEDACQGDSGGPLMCERDGLWYQAGIVAGGYLCGHKASPGLYTRIAYYSDWIRTTMELNDG